MSTDIHQLIQNNPMSRYQVQAIFVCLVINMLDGFDVLVMAFTASSVASEWGLQGGEVGILLSAGLFGMAGGSLFLAPLADKWGRRPLVLICLVIISVGMLLSALSQNAAQLAFLRMVTGLGIGGMLASLNVIVSEYSSIKWRSMAVSCLQSGYPIGAVIGGTIAAFLIGQYGWRSVFIFGSISSFAMIPLVIWRLPESFDFIMFKRPLNGLQKINHLLRCIGSTPLESMPAQKLQNDGLQPKVSSLFKGELKRVTLLSWLAYFLVMFSFYFVLSWTPKLLVAAGLSAEGGISAGVLVNLGGVVGGLLLGYASSRLALSKLITTYMGTTAFFMVVFGLFSTSFFVAMGLGIIIGVFLFGSMIGLYALVPNLYPAAIRTTGMGWSIGIGRVGAVLSPIIAGALIDLEWQVSSLYLLFAVPMVLSMFVVNAIQADKKNHYDQSVSADGL